MTLLFPDDDNTEKTDAKTILNANVAWKTFVSGAVAGMISRTCTAPFDRLKTVMQAVGSRKHITILGGFKHMLNEGGVWSLWRGNGMNVMKVGPEAAIRFMLYEEIKIIFIEDTKLEPTITQRFFAGSIAGGLAQSIIYPLEVLKTRLVLRKTGEYKNTLDCFRRIKQREGLGAFYKGFFTNILGIIPYAGVDLAVYETLKLLYMEHNNQINDHPSIPVLLLCGTASSICGQLLSYPLALVRTRLQAQEKPLDSSERMTQIFKQIWKNEGVRGLYRGLLPNIMKSVPAVSISYVVYENTKKNLS